MSLDPEYSNRRGICTFGYCFAGNVIDPVSPFATTSFVSESYTFALILEKCTERKLSCVFICRLAAAAKEKFAGTRLNWGSVSARSPSVTLTRY